MPWAPDSAAMLPATRLVAALHIGVGTERNSRKDVSMELVWSASRWRHAAHRALGGRPVTRGGSIKVVQRHNGACSRGAAVHLTGGTQANAAGMFARACYEAAGACYPLFLQVGHVVLVIRLILPSQVSIAGRQDAAKWEGDRFEDVKLA